MKTKSQKGMTLIEMVLVLVIGTSIIAGGVAYYNSAQATAATKDLVAGVVALQAATRAVAAGSSSYGYGSLNAALIRQGRVPTVLKPSGSSMTSPSGFPISVEGMGVGFIIKLTPGSKDDCLALLTGSGTFQAYQVDVAAVVMTTPASITAAAAACTASQANLTLVSYF